RGSLFAATGAGSEAVLRRDAIQVGGTLELAEQAVVRRLDADVRGVRLQARVGEAELQVVGVVPGGTDRVPLAILVRQARGAVRERGRGLVVGVAGTQGPRVVEHELAADGGEPRLAPAERLDGRRVRAIELDAHFLQRLPAGFRVGRRHGEAVGELVGDLDRGRARGGQLGACPAVLE